MKKIIMCFVMAFVFTFSSMTVYAEESFCDNYQKFAENVMKAHQYGVSEKVVIDTIISSNVDGVVQMIDLAHIIYNTPIMKTDKGKKDIIKKIGIDVYYECVKAVYKHGLFDGPKS